MQEEFIEKKNKRSSLIYTLTKSDVIALFIYYIVLFLVGAFGNIFILVNLSFYLEHYLVSSTLICSIAMATIFCCMQYIKCIYKACIDERVNAPEDKRSKKRIGNIFYFILRPLFSVAFVIIALFCVLGGLFIVTSSLEYVLNDRFFYLCIVISAIVGFSTGKLLDDFEIFSYKKIKEHLN